MTGESSVSSPAIDCVGHFEFAFNPANFSDRVLKIEVLDDVAGSTSDAQRSREEEEEATSNKGGQCMLYILLCFEQCQCLTTQKWDSLSTDEPLESNGTSSSADCPNILKVEFVHVNASILAAKSKFFFKLFSNGMQESGQQCVTLRINASEEATFMELLQFMYGYKVSSTSHTFLVNLMVIADKFEVPLRWRYCTYLAESLPMTNCSALFYLYIPPHPSISFAIQPLRIAAKEFFANKYKNITRFEDEILALPFKGIQSIFAGDDLQVPSEDYICKLLVKWAKRHYPQIEHRRKFFSSTLFRLIRFPHVSYKRLMKFFQNEHLYLSTTKLISMALLFKGEAPQARCLDQWFIQRAYSDIPIQMVEFDMPSPHCIVYLNLKKEDLVKLVTQGDTPSQKFYLGGQGFFLLVSCRGGFGLYLGIRKKNLADFTVEFEFSARAKPHGEYESKFHSLFSFTGPATMGTRNLFELPWEFFMAENCRYFLSGVVHLRVQMSFKPPHITHW